jgi:hypothetical protein
METTLLIEADGQPTVSITIEAEPDLVFHDTGIQGPPGPPGSAGEAGDAIRIVGEVVHVDINGLTLAP